MRWTVLCVVLIGSAACRSYDPEIFDRRLRAATFDGYAQALLRDAGGPRAVGIDVAALTARYRGPTIAAADPAEFYARIAALLAETRDPHSDLRVLGPRAPAREAVPFRCRFVRFDDEVWVVCPRGAALAGKLPDAPLPEDPAALAKRLCATVDDSPLRWNRVRSIDGVSVHHPHEARLLAPGPLLSTFEIEIEDQAGAARSLALVRNARLVWIGGRQVAIGPDTLVRALHRQGAPESLPEVSDGDRGDLAGLFARGERIRADARELGPFGSQMEAWRLGDVGYAAISSFHLAGSERSRGDELEEFRAAVQRIVGGLRGCSTVIIDVRGNPGGSWLTMGLWLSALLPDEDVLPFSIRTRSSKWLGLVKLYEVKRLARAPIEALRAERFIVLVDQSTASAGEVIASALRGRRGAILIGERTSGAEYAVRSVEGPDGSRITFGEDGGMAAGCERFQGRGLSPDVDLPLRREDVARLGFWRALRAHRRAVLATALRAAGLDPGDWLAPEIVQPVGAAARNAKRSASSSTIAAGSRPAVSTIVSACR